MDILQQYEEEEKNKTIMRNKKQSVKTGGVGSRTGVLSSNNKNVRQKQFLAIAFCAIAVGILIFVLISVSRGSSAPPSRETERREHGL